MNVRQKKLLVLVLTISLVLSFGTSAQAKGIADAEGKGVITSADSTSEESGMDVEVVSVFDSLFLFQELVIEENDKLLREKVFEKKKETEKTDVNTAKKKKQKTEKKKEENSWEHEFCVTAYCGCYECSEEYGNMTSTGSVAEEGRTIAVDPEVIPYGSKVIINGHEYVAEDCGGAINGYDIDIFFDNHSETYDWGVRHIECTVYPG